MTLGWKPSRAPIALTGGKSWQELARVHHDLALGAICDRDTLYMAIWREIGRTAVASSDMAERYQWAGRLGIGGVATYVPFPLVVKDGG